MQWNVFFSFLGYNAIFSRSIAKAFRLMNMRMNKSQTNRTKKKKPNVKAKLWRKSFSFFSHFVCYVCAPLSSCRAEKKMSTFFIYSRLTWVNGIRLQWRSAQRRTGRVYRAKTSMRTKYCWSLMSLIVFVLCVFCAFTQNWTDIWCAWDLLLFNLTVASN